MIFYDAQFMHSTNIQLKKEMGMKWALPRLMLTHHMNIVIVGDDIVAKKVGAWTDVVLL